MGPNAAGGRGAMLSQEASIQQMARRRCCKPGLEPSHCRPPAKPSSSQRKGCRCRRHNKHTARTRHRQAGQAMVRKQRDRRPPGFRLACLAALLSDAASEPPSCCGPRLAIQKQRVVGTLGAVFGLLPRVPAYTVRPHWAGTMTEGSIRPCSKYIIAAAQDPISSVGCDPGPAHAGQMVEIAPMLPGQVAPCRPAGGSCP